MELKYPHNLHTSQNIEELKLLVNYTIERHFPEITSSQNKALDLLNLRLQALFHK